MDQRHVKRCLIEALHEVYDTFKVQSSHELSDKQRRFISVAVKKICGKALPKGETFDKPETTPVIDKDDKPFYECECGKRCSSSSGLTLHKKLVHGSDLA